MALPTKQEIEELAASLNQAVSSYSDAPDLDGYISRVQIIAKAKELMRTLIMPEQIPNYHGLNMAELIAIRTFIKLKVLDAIPETGSISLQDLSKATGAQDSLLERMGRILVASGFLDQTTTRPDAGGEYYYKHTKFSLVYRLPSSGQPMPGHLFLAMYDDWFKKMHDFDEYLAARGQLSAAREPEDPLHNPYTHASGQAGTPVWAIMAQDPERLDAFQKGMSGIDVAIPVVGHFDFSLLAARSDEEEGTSIIEIVDVGGGSGAVLNQILSTHEELDPNKAVLQEREVVIEIAKLNVARGKLKGGVQLQVHDFMAEQPVKGAKAYFMRMILHDYADAVGIQILSRLSEAMNSESRVLICEMVLPSRVSEADFPAAVMDMAVMTMGGKERTQDGFRKMFEAAGLELVSVWRVPGVPGACVEGRLKR